MLAFQIPDTEPLAWFDIAGLVTLAVFAILGLWKGFGWQVSRLLVIVAAYAVALLFGDALAPELSGWFQAADDPEIPRHVAQTALFVGVVALVGLVVWFAQRFREPKPVSGLSRVLGAAAGVVVGGLVLLAILTGVGMFLGDRGVARAAESSHSARVGREALELAAKVLPAEYQAGARHWRTLLGESGGDAAAPLGQPGDATFRRSDGAQANETPAEALPPRDR